MRWADCSRAGTRCSSACLPDSVSSAANARRAGGSESIRVETTRAELADDIVTLLDRLRIAEPVDDHSIHAYDPVSGRQRDDYEIYAPIIEHIRSKSDLICHGTLPFAGSGGRKLTQRRSESTRA
jgi:hypothetical protein